MQPETKSLTPLLSIVIPCYNVARYIDRCLDSITVQAFQNIEIIAVDGGSKDETYAKVTKRAEEEPRLATIPTERIGPGRARNIGAQHATGDYIWFVDGDDQLAPGCLSVIAERLHAQRPDVLLINHAVLMPDGALRSSHDHRMIMREDDGSFEIADRPWLVDLSLVCWNKIVRREFLASAGAEFASSWPHEDVPHSCNVLLTAHRLAVFSAVCYHYRQRPGSTTSAGPRRRHFAVFETWPPVLERIRIGTTESYRLREVYRRFFQRSIWHCSMILDTTGLIARADRRAFFRSISTMYNAYVPAGYRLPNGFRGIKFWLIARNFYVGYAALHPLNKARMAMVRTINRTRTRPDTAS